LKNSGHRISSTPIGFITLICQKGAPMDQEPPPALQNVGQLHFVASKSQQETDAQQFICHQLRSIPL
jgi:hypothetical protein